MKDCADRKDARSCSKNESLFPETLTPITDAPRGHNARDLSQVVPRRLELRGYILSSKPHQNSTRTPPELHQNPPEPFPRCSHGKNKEINEQNKTGKTLTLLVQGKVSWTPCASSASCHNNNVTMNVHMTKINRERDKVTRRLLEIEVVRATLETSSSSLENSSWLSNLEKFLPHFKDKFLTIAKQMTKPNVKRL